MCKVSVIIPYYNNEKTIIRALESVINQTYKDFEIILIDDGSTDDSHRLVDEFIKYNLEYEIKNLYQKNSGPSKARNNGIKNSNGEYIAFLDADDSWLKYKLSIQMNFLNKNKEIYILGSDYMVIDDNIKIIKGKNIDSFERNTFYLRLFKNTFPTSTVVIKRKALTEIGLFNEKQKYAEDTLLYLKILRKFKGGKIQLPLTTYYKYEYGSGGLSANLKELEKWELNNFKILYRENYKHQKKINLFLYLCIIVFSYAKYLRRMILCKIRKFKKR